MTFLNILDKFKAECIYKIMTSNNCNVDIWIGILWYYELYSVFKVMAEVSVHLSLESWMDCHW